MRASIAAGAVPVESPAPLSSATRSATLFAVGALLIVALALRAPYFGNPDIHVDEEFYALVADQMWKGALPYVDIWDRKPIGLFLIYALFRPISGASLIDVQLLGLICAWGTAMLIWVMARRYTQSSLALFPAILYLFWQGVFEGFSAQSPVFYNFPMALAALLCLRATDRSDGKNLIGIGVAAMALVGLSIQIKYTAIFEGFFFGLWLVWLRFRMCRSFAAIAGPAFLWVMTALAPTLAVAASYAMMGHWAAFAQANFTSIFLRARLEATYLASLQAFVAIAGLPLLVTALAGLAGHICFERTPRPDRWFLLGWLISALCGFTAIGNFYHHYALPLLPPLLVVASRCFMKRMSAGLIFLSLAAWASIWWPPRPADATMRSRATIARLASAAKPYLRYGPMFIWDGPSILYVAVDATPPTRFAYPDHLSNVVEKDALGADTGKEIRKILAQRPAIIVSSSSGLIPRYNPVTHHLIQAALARDYIEMNRQVAGWGNRDYILYARRDLVHSLSTKRGGEPSLNS